jgi:hypothetical protein
VSSGMPGALSLHFWGGVLWGYIDMVKLSEVMNLAKVEKSGRVGCRSESNTAQGEENMVQVT